MSAKKLGRITAGLFVALGLAFGGSLLAAVDGSGTASVAADTSTVVLSGLNREIEWH
jgi:hypothetical protein